MSEAETYEYQPMCSMPGCDRPAIYKVGAIWSNGRFTELKNYGTCCDGHRPALLAQARRRRANGRLAAGETLGEVALYQLLPSFRDADLSRVPDEGV